MVKLKYMLPVVLAVLIVLHSAAGNQNEAAGQCSSPSSTPVSMTAVERTFVAIKPDGVQRGLVGQILQRFERKGLQVIGLKMVKPSVEIAEMHYEEHRQKPFFSSLVSYFTSGPIVLVALQGPKSIEVSRALIGKTRPHEAAPGTIRFDFAVDASRNVVHGSDSAESAARELQLWFSPDELLDWSPALTQWLHE
jgi:nucleoside-diphosphate kinase